MSAEAPAIQVEWWQQEPASVEEELSLFSLIRDDAEGVHSHVKEALRHLDEAEDELERILEVIGKSLTGSPKSITPHSLSGVRSAAEYVLERLHEPDVGGLLS